MAPVLRSCPDSSSVTDSQCKMKCFTQCVSLLSEMHNYTELLDEHRTLKISQQILWPFVVVLMELGFRSFPALNSQQSSCLIFLSAGITDTYYQTWPFFYYSLFHRDFYFLTYLGICFYF